MKQIKESIKNNLEERGWDKLDPADLAKSIIIESAELLEVFQWDNTNNTKGEMSDEKLSKIKKELADVFIYCFEMAIMLDLDPKDIINEKLELINKKYPVDIFNKDTSLEEESQKKYLEIKNAYREEGRN